MSEGRLVYFRFPPVFFAGFAPVFAPVFLEGLVGRLPPVPPPPGSPSSVPKYKMGE